MPEWFNECDLKELVSIRSWYQILAEASSHDVNVHNPMRSYVRDVESEFCI